MSVKTKRFRTEIYQEIANEVQKKNWMKVKEHMKKTYKTYSYDLLSIDELEEILIYIKELE